MRRAALLVLILSWAHAEAQTIVTSPSVPFDGNKVHCTGACINAHACYDTTAADMYFCKANAWVASGTGTLLSPLIARTTTATDDKLSLAVTAGGAASFTGTLSSVDLTAARAWTLPNWPGTIPIPTTVGTTTTVLHGDASGQPVFGSVTTTDLNFTPLTTANGTWCAQIFLGATGAGIKAANTVLAQFKTGAASTVTDVMWATNVVGTAGTGTATLDLTDTSGVVKCTINFDCTTADSIGNGSCSSTALSANTIYQARAKAQCAGNGSIMYPYTCWRWTTP